LEVGAAAESITVTDAAPLLITESAEISYNITMDRLKDLPVGNMGSVRNAVRQAAQLMPGVTFAPGGVKINGTPADGYNLRIDGMDNTYTLGNLLVTQVQPSVEAIEQYSIQTSNFAAELGQSGGAIFNVNMKSGTNQFHGSIYDFWAKDVLYAANSFTKIKNPVSNYDYGFTIGGPIRVPKVYNGTNKSFFFFSYETRPSTGQNLNSFLTVPTDAYRTGDLSAALTINGTRAQTQPVARLSRTQFTIRRRISPTRPTKRSAMPSWATRFRSRASIPCRLKYWRWCPRRTWQPPDFSTTTTSRSTPPPRTICRRSSSTTISPRTTS
jgi:hypothetical protein